MEVTLTTGRTPEQLRALISRVTQAVVQSIGAPGESVRVIIREVPKAHYAAGGQTLAEREVEE